MGREGFDAVDLIHRSVFFAATVRSYDEQLISRCLPHSGGRSA